MRQNKKGVSEIVSYVLLIVIAVALAGAVFAYLKLYIPKEKPQCEQDISLIIQNYSCKTGELEVTFLNKGLFSADAAYVRLGEKGRKVRQLINPNCLHFISGQDCDTKGSITKEGLKPGEAITKIYKSSQITSGEKELEIQAALIKGDELVLCEKAIATQDINCQ